MAHRDDEAPSVHRHRAAAPTGIGCAIITVSDTRTLEDDSGGALIAELLGAASHRAVSREIVPDDIAAIRSACERACARDDCAAILLTGGTGVAPRDVTPEAVRPLLDRELPGFGELFRVLSHAEIGSAALLSRAVGGMVGSRVLFALPGSRGAIRTALEQLILPELGHLVGESRRPG